MNRSRISQYELSAQDITNGLLGLSWHVTEWQKALADFLSTEALLNLHFNVGHLLGRVDVFWSDFVRLAAF